MKVLPEAGMRQPTIKTENEHCRSGLIEPGFGQKMDKTQAGSKLLGNLSAKSAGRNLCMGILAAPAIRPRTLLIDALERKNQQ
jgi:hypothetical protein